VATVAGLFSHPIARWLNDEPGCKAATIAIVAVSGAPCQWTAF
jgi:hypothetical protein